MSPEQCRGEPIDARSDQYALAIVLYQMTTGRLPFEADTPMATALKHVNEPLPRPRLVNPRIPEEVELVLVRALAKDPALRYGSVLELDDAFQEALRMALDPARHAKTRDVDRTTAIYNKYQNVKPPPRRRWFERSALAAALLVLLACPAGAAATAWFYPALFNGGASAAAVPLDVQGTVDVLLTLNAPAGTDLPPGAMQTAIYAAVVQTLTANGTPVEAPGVQAVAFGAESEATATPLAFSLFFPASSPAATRTLAPGESPVPPTATPSPTNGPSPTVGSTAGVSPTSAGSSPLPTIPVSATVPMSVGTDSGPTATPVAPSATAAPPTGAPTNTSAPPPATNTSAPPATTNTPAPPPATNTPAPPPATNTPAPPPPTSTPRPPTSTPDWKSDCGPDVPPGQCKKTQTAAAGG
jgi:serine/threonine-protein kinase